MRKIQKKIMEVNMNYSIYLVLGFLVFIGIVLAGGKVQSEKNQQG